MQPEALNKKAIQIINRVRDKLTGEFCGIKQALTTNTGSYNNLIFLHDVFA